MIDNPKNIVYEKILPDTFILIEQPKLQIEQPKLQIEQPKLQIEQIINDDIENQ